MVQNVSNQAQNSYGSLNKIGMTSNGRVLYQVVDASGQNSAKLSVAPQQADTFEKSYNTIMQNAPRMQKYVETMGPEKLEKKQKMAKWMVFGGAVLGGIYPLLKIKCNGFWGFVKSVGLTLLGAGAGGALGVYGASKIVTPPGAKELTKATQVISKLDIQPEQ